MGFQKRINTGIKRLRIQNFLTQEQFAEKVGLTNDAVKNLENNKYAPRARTIDGICEKFGISPIDLLLEDTNAEKALLIETLNNKFADLDVSQLQMFSNIVDVIKKKY